MSDFNYRNQIASCGLDGPSHPPPSPALSFEQLSQKNGHGIKNDKSGTTPTTFTCFGALPAELRLLIWSKACEQQRNVQIDFKLDGKGAGPKPIVYVCNTPDSDVLYACKESREEVLKNYSLLFGTAIAKGPAPPRIWYNSKVDIILPGTMWRRRVYEDFFSKIAATDSGLL